MMAGQVSSFILRPRASHWVMGLAALMIIVSTFALTDDHRLNKVPMQIALMACTNLDSYCTISQEYDSYICIR